MPKKVINLDTKQFQWDFYSATNRFPGSIAGWGSGKTMWALMKGDLLSRFYKNNLGVIIRSKFTDLRDSTMKDFTKWTGKTIPQGTKEAKYANGSQILFRHAKELSGLQNVNLGWAYIEQAEEFPTDTQFQLLRGRLRRDLEVDEDYWATYTERWDDLDPRTQALLRSMYDNPLRQIMPVANAKGHNWLWKMFIKSPQEGYSCMQATSFDNEDNLPADFIKDLRRMEKDSPAKYKQYVMNCHDEVDLDACYYIEIMNQLRANGHICHVAHDPSVLVYVSWDIGLDCTALWFRQTVRGQRRLIDYYENTGKFVAHYDKIMKSKPYSYAKMILPHDGKARSKVSGESYKKALEDLEYKVIVNKRIEKDVGINIVADALPSYYIDEEKCKDGLEALDHYRREYDEENRIYKEKPLHDWASHPMDSLKEMCQADKSGFLSSSSSITVDKIRKLQKQYSRTG